MNLRHVLLIGFIVTLTEGKGCPQHSKPHLTRCDMYFKCALLPSKNHVWIPTKCDAGLIYEPSLKMCVLAGDDWECTLGENNQFHSGSDENNVYGINNLGYVGQTSEEDKDGTAELNQMDPNLANQMDSTIEKGSQEDSNENIVVVNNDNYDENNIEISDGYEPVPLVSKDETLGQPQTNLNQVNEAPVEVAEEIESSGDGQAEPIDTKIENKENYFAIPINSDPNTSVATHLQRLSQLIQSLSDSQHNQSQTYELGPNDLNNFLANHNIQSEYPSQIVSNINRHPIPNDGKIHPDHMSEILQIQQKLQDLSNMVLSSTTAATTPPTTTTASPNVEKYPEMTRIRMKNSSPLKTSKNDPGYSSSQIVVNRPEGSVLFSIPAGAQSQPISNEPVKNNPYISEETLKTMLELSKQMISGGQHQNQNSIPEQNYLQPIFRPIYYNIPIHELPIPVLSTNVNDKTEKNSKKRKPIKDDTKDSLNIYQNNDYIDSQDAPSHYELVSDWTDDDGKKSDDHATIIHNHIPITIEGSVPAATSGSVKKYNSQHNIEPSYTTEATYNNFAPKPNSNNDNYNNYVPVPIKNYNKPYEIDPPNDSAYQSYPIPTPSNYNQKQSYSGYASRPENTYSNYNQKPDVAYSVYVSKPGSSNYQPQSYNQNGAYAGYSVHEQSTYPYYSQQQQIPSSQAYYNAYNTYSNSGYNSNNYPLIPLQQQQQNQSPYYQNSQYQVQNPAASYYTAAPHLNEQNVNNYFSINTPSYPTIKPSGSFMTSNPPGASYQNQINPPVTEGSQQTQENEKDSDEDIALSDESDESNVQSDEERDDDIIDSAESGNNPNHFALKSDLFSSVDDLTSTLLNDNRKKIVYFAGNFMSYDTFEKTIQPLLRTNPSIANDIDVITCVTGARQPNKTDCTRYFVCNSKTGIVLPYLCPPFTAFNSQTRFCDAKTYATCNPVHIQTQITIDENKKIQMKAQQALNEANRVRDEALKTQRLATLIRLQTQNLLKEPIVVQPIQSQSQQMVVSQRPPFKVYRTTRKPMTAAASGIASGGSKQPRIRKIACREPGKVPDSLSRYNYFLCYKGADNKLRARKMTCPGALVFCRAARLCMTSDKCVQ